MQPIESFYGAPRTSHDQRRNHDDGKHREQYRFHDGVRVQPVPRCAAVLHRQLDVSGCQAVWRLHVATWSALSIVQKEPHGSCARTG